ncbi:GTPase RsgA [Bacteroides xylanisolvens]|nr:GTPase RsgA [Bacteroides xylanisolvens]
MNNENQTIHKSDDNLTIYGWNEKLNQLKQESIYSALAHGRVSIVHRTCYEVISGNGLFQCELTGNMMYGKSDDELPCTGDWVIFQPFDEHKGIIVDSLPRERTLYRKKSGTVADKQAIASYVDKAFIVQSLDDNFNVRRVERFMVQIMEENISSVLVLNKADLDFDRQSVEEQIKHISKSDTRIFHEYSSARNNCPVTEVHIGRRNGCVCRFFGCREKLFGECSL